MSNDRPTQLIQEADETWDAVVVGAGPGGSVAAILLARQNLKTLLVERKAFPRPKVCGGCLNGRALAILQRTGLGGICDQLQATQFNNLRVRVGKSMADIPLPQGRGISRGALDAALAQRAAEEGVTVRTQTMAQVQPGGASSSMTGRRQVLLRDFNGREIRAAAGVIIAADGLGHSSLAGLPEFVPRVQSGARVGLGTLIPVAQIPESAWTEPPNTICMSVSRWGYVGVARVEQGQLSVAAAVDARLVQEHGSAGAIRKMLDSVGLPSGLIRDDSRWIGTPPLTRSTPQAGGERLFLLGDALGYLEPFTGEGMAWAMTSAVAVTPLAVEAVQAWQPHLTQIWKARYNQVVRREQMACRGVTWLARRPRLASIVIRMLAVRPQMALPIVRTLNLLPKHMEAWI